MSPDGPVAGYATTILLHGKDYLGREFDEDLTESVLVTIADEAGTAVVTDVSAAWDDAASKWAYLWQVPSNAEGEYHVTGVFTGANGSQAPVFETVIVSAPPW